MTENLLYYGDNLKVLPEIVDASVDLIYLDPPFNSNQNYNVLFEEHDGTQAAAQIKAFTDTWKWDEAAAVAYALTVETAPERLAKVMRAFHTCLGDSDLMAYLAMMAPRLMELRRVLKETGCIYLHCDPTASHYLKMLMDGVFGGESFANEIVWRRTTTKNDYRQGAVNWPRVHDVLLVYHRSTSAARKAGRFVQPFTPYEDEYVSTFYSFSDPDGRRYRLSDLSAPGQGSRGHPKYEFLGVTRHWRYNQEKMEQLYRDGRVEFRPTGKVPRLKVYLDEAPGVAIGDVWVDIRGMINFGKEMLGYPTQKPEALLDRIITASTQPGDLVLDPFCGCGTAISSAQKLGRRWIGIDITHLAVGLIKSRLVEAYGDAVNFRVKGEPEDEASARELARTEPHDFQAWALGLAGARRDGKKGPDRGIDGQMFLRDGRGEHFQIIFSVKSGKLKADDIRALGHVVQREGADMGALLTLNPPTAQMRADAIGVGFFECEWGKYPKLQIITVGELLAGKQLDHPRLSKANATFRTAPKYVAKVAETLNLPLGYGA